MENRSVPKINPEDLKAAQKDLLEAKDLGAGEADQFVPYSLR